MDKNLSKILQFLYPELKDTVSFTGITDYLDISKREKMAPFSLANITMKAILKEGLRDEKKKKVVMLYLREETPYLHNLHWFQKYPHLFLTALATNCQAPGITLGFIMTNSTFEITISKQKITEFRRGKNVEWLWAFINMIIVSNLYSFSIFVTESSETETKKQKLERILEKISGFPIVFDYFENIFNKAEEAEEAHDDDASEGVAPEEDAPEDSTPDDPEEVRCSLRCYVKKQFDLGKGSIVYFTKEGFKDGHCHHGCTLNSFGK